MATKPIPKLCSMRKTINSLTFIVIWFKRYGTLSSLEKMIRSAAEVLSPDQQYAQKTRFDKIDTVFLKVRPQLLTLHISLKVIQ
jgi:hypothetical protein